MRGSKKSSGINERMHDYEVESKTKWVLARMCERGKQVAKFRSTHTRNHLLSLRYGADMIALASFYYKFVINLYRKITSSTGHSIF